LQSQQERTAGCGLGMPLSAFKLKTFLESGLNTFDLIAHCGLDFFYTYRLKRNAFHFDPQPEWNRSQTWRIAAQITPEGDGLLLTCWRRCYLLVREDCWKSFDHG
jgi:hypothetical protein